MPTVTDTWNGSNADWNTPGDWSTGSVPNTGNDAVINSGNGRVYFSGGRGRQQIENTFGDVEVRTNDGELVVRNANGAVLATDINGSVDVTDRFGKVRVVNGARTKWLSARGLYQERLF